MLKCKLTPIRLTNVSSYSRSWSQNVHLSARTGIYFIEYLRYKWCTYSFFFYLCLNWSQTRQVTGSADHHQQSSYFWPARKSLHKPQSSAINLLDKVTRPGIFQETSWACWNCGGDYSSDITQHGCHVVVLPALSSCVKVPGNSPFISLTGNT